MENANDGGAAKLPAQQPKPGGSGTGHRRTSIMVWLEDEDGSSQAKIVLQQSTE